VNAAHDVAENESASPANDPQVIVSERTFPTRGAVILVVTACTLLLALVAVLTDSSAAATVESRWARWTAEQAVNAIQPPNGWSVQTQPFVACAENCGLPVAVSTTWTTPATKGWCNGLGETFRQELTVACPPLRSLNDQTLLGAWSEGVGIWSVSAQVIRATNEEPVVQLITSYRID
jgi:hypothetical protein